MPTLVILVRSMNVINSMGDIISLNIYKEIDDAESSTLFVLKYSRHICPDGDLFQLPYFLLATH